MINSVGKQSIVMNNHRQIRAKIIRERVNQCIEMVMSRMTIDKCFMKMGHLRGNVRIAFSRYFTEVGEGWIDV